MKQKCKECNRNFRNLTKESLCAYCHKIKYNSWAKEFSEPENVKK